MIIHSYCVSFFRFYLDFSEFFYEVRKIPYKHNYEIWFCHEKCGIKDFIIGCEFFSPSDLENYLCENYEADKDFYISEYFPEYAYLKKEDPI